MVSFGPKERTTGAKSLVRQLNWALSLICLSLIRVRNAIVRMVFCGHILRDTMSKGLILVVS